MIVKSGFPSIRGFTFWFARNENSVWHPCVFDPNRCRNPVYMRAQIEWVKKQVDND